jgi:hypothetical protein
MSNQYFKGFAVIRGAAGSVTLAGRATALVNSTPSATVSDVSPVMEHTDSLGVPRTKTRPFRRFRLELEIIPGSGSSIAVGDLDNAAALQDVAGNIEQQSSIVTTGFAIADFNWASGGKIVGEPSINLSSEGSATIRITAERTLDSAGTEITFDTTSHGWETT